MRKCQPGVICIENVTMFVVIIFFLFIFLYFILYSRTRIEVHNNNSTNTSTKTENDGERGFFSPAFLGNWFPDVLLNPYSPPLRDERYFIAPSAGVVPINVSTNIGAVDTSYRQVGILTSLNSKGSILALMGRPLFVNRDKWQYYTMSDQNNSVKLPISKAGRSCTNEYGCDKIYNGDTVYVEGYNDAYRVTIYDNNVVKYLPFV